MKSKLSIIATSAFCLLLFAATAYGQTAQRTFVSTSGNDANTASLCSTANPCRSFTAAQTVTSSGGEIIALTSGGYGPVQINQAVQITAPTGVYVAITALPTNAIGGTDAIRVNAGSTDTVVLRGLTLNSLGVQNGITFPAGQSLYIENCVINGFTDKSISVERVSSNTPELFVTDTVIRNGDLSASSSNAGIFLRQTAGGGLIHAMIDNCRLERAAYIGLNAADRTHVTMRNTIAMRNSFGVTVSASTGTTAELEVENSTVTHNLNSGIFVGDGTSTGGAARAYISNTVSSNNAGNGIYVHTNGTGHVSDSTVNGNSFAGIFVSNNASARLVLTFTTIFGNAGKGLDRNSGSPVNTAVSVGNNRISDNTAGSDAFSSTVAQQ